MIVKACWVRGAGTATEHVKELGKELASRFLFLMIVGRIVACQPRSEEITEDVHEAAEADEEPEVHQCACGGKLGL